MAERNTYSKDRNYLKDNTDVKLKEMEWESMDWINLAQDKGTRQSVVNMVTERYARYHAGNSQTS
jgi:hypothetical protein